MATVVYPFSAFAASSGVVSLSRLESEVRGHAAILVALEGISAGVSGVSVVFRAALDAGGAAALDGIVAGHSGLSLPDKTIITVDSPQTNKALPVAIAPREGVGDTVYSTHLYTRRDGWYSQSARVTNAALVDTGDGLTWGTPGHSWWIDFRHGLVQDEEGISAEAADREPGHHGWRVVVTVDGAPMAARLPFADSGGDYTIDHALGRITFAASQAGKDVRASYSYAQGSAWILRPTAGKALYIRSAEVQFSDDIVMNSDIVFQAKGPAGVFAPQLGLPPDTLIVLSETRYKHFRQMVDEARGAYPPIPPMGGAKRGTTKTIYGFPFEYSSARVLSSAAQMELWISLEGDVPMGGEHATGTFRCESLVDGG